MNANFHDRDPELFRKYGHLVEGIEHYSKDPRLTLHEQNKMMILLENSVQNFCNENGIQMNLSEMSESLKEAVTTNTNIATFVKTQLPLVRKVFPAMISAEIASFRPMSQPTMKVYYHDIKRGTGDTSLSTSIHDQRAYGDNVEYDVDSPTAIKDIYMSITSVDVSATIKKLKYKHTVEAQQDIMAYHGLNISNELTFALSSEIVREWDRTILQDMLDNATGGSATFDRSVPASITYSDRKVWMEGIYEAMVDVDTAIFTKRYRKTNFVVVPATLAGFIEKMHGFIADPVSVDMKVIRTGGRYFMGTLNSRWRVYCDPFFPTNKILMGYNNPQDWMDTSYVFCPYIMSYFSPEFTDPDTFVKSKAILSRAARKTVVGDLLGIVTVTGS